MSKLFIIFLQVYIPRRIRGSLDSARRRVPDRPAIGIRTVFPYHPAADHSRVTALSRNEFHHVHHRYVIENENKIVII